MKPAPEAESRSLAGDVGGSAGAMWQAINDPAKRGRVAGALLNGGMAFLRGLSRALHMLWLQVTGLFFLAFAAAGAFAWRREYVQYAAGDVGVGRVWAAAVFTIVFAWFGITSFWRARRKP